MFPYEIRPVGGSVSEDLSNHFKGRRGFVQVGPKKWLLPIKYAEHAEKYYTFKVEKDDLWIITFPRSGTTWMQEILWLINNDLDYKTAQKLPIFDRFPFFEFNISFGKEFLEEITALNRDNPQALEELKLSIIPGYKLAEKMKAPRHFKSHLPPSLLPPSLVDTCKVVYVARNPYDVAVSFYHHNKLFRVQDYQGDFNKYWEFFENGYISYSPYWEHLKEGWAMKDHPNVLFLFYEDLIRDFTCSIKKICTFLNKQMTEDEIKKLADHVHIDNFRKNVPVMRAFNIKGMINPDAQNFIRRGKIGGNTEFEGELKKRADKWFEENALKSGIQFPTF